MRVELTKDQKFILDHLMNRMKGEYFKNAPLFFNPDFKYVTIGGLAGTGKTFLISKIREEIENYWSEDFNVAFVAFTGKAANILRQKLNNDNVLYDNDFCGTIHSLIYYPKIIFDQTIKQYVVVDWIRKDNLDDYSLIIIDEASMINKTLWDDLSSYNIPIIAVGDHGQLPPVSNDGFSLMSKLDYILTEIKRQTFDNPIIKLAYEVRQGKGIPDGIYENKFKNIFKLNWNSKSCKDIFDKIDFLNDDVIFLCWKNSTRNYFNNLIRKKYCYNIQEPHPGEKIIFLKNNYTTGIFNGMLGISLFSFRESKHILKSIVELDGYSEPYSGYIYSNFFSKDLYDMSELGKKEYIKELKRLKFPSVDLCDWGYAITVHKSQGSEFKKVVVYDEMPTWNVDRIRWLYTAVTRAKNSLFIISPGELK